MNTVFAQPMISPVSVAPMMDWTDRHFRTFLRFITKKTLLYTEMVTTGAILRGDRNRHLGFSLEELPLSLQLGGNEPSKLAECAKIGSDFGYSEINLNVGCPSDKVQEGNFGACLMRHPDQVAECISEMSAAVRIPVTVKCRIGIPGKDQLEDLLHFVEKVHNAGANRITIHARIAILEGLSPAQNRSVPPLRYGDVYQVKKSFPNVIVEINGGIKTLDEVNSHLNHVDGVMIGRAAYENPFLFSKVDELFFGMSPNQKSKREIFFQLNEYLQRNIDQGEKPARILKHVLGAFHGVRGAKSYRRILTEGMHVDFSSDLLERALQNLPNEELDSAVTASPEFAF
ncbi:tRNA dihydrouridine(20/20a) synthase DusA [Leptospira perolatii]|uniref:tRNA-dihydrouridine(20/20a) synthase n=1 Tax=Leptospira perolatii TaxID=2023191 RepID=A0A2M9ZIR4_9LEPT|nr:tRNA dihydrouridine(20/20a) synthase DusA [Leptospira perolatii]PJZ68171.1 tRNA dihydrouridine(20/20a) synthase DusA [Leptospira perolatii]PJZ71949.1 tRNA dihydrouridine(20/20a) synthase DusA [Leptospira perolatii]